MEKVDVGKCQKKCLVVALREFRCVEADEEQCASPLLIMTMPQQQVIMQHFFFTSQEEQEGSSLVTGTVLHGAQVRPGHPTAAFFLLEWRRSTVLGSVCFFKSVHLYCV